MNVPGHGTEFGGIVLVGGQSRRMKTPKAWLPFGDETSLQRVVRICRQVLNPVVVVAAVGQDLPELPEQVEIVRDKAPGRGPLEGLAAGFEGLPEHVTGAFATSCDVPLLRAEFIQRVCERLRESEIAVPVADGYHHPLAAVYRRDVHKTVRALLNEDRLRPFFLFQQHRTRELQPSDFSDVDPELHCLMNMNTPDDYLAALRRLHLRPPDEIMRIFDLEQDE